ncbi:MAG TPA: hypothetical protein VGD17_09180 [Chitinophagaceae bacterium]
MTSRNYIGLFGAVLVMAGGMSPMLRIPIIGNWNYWDIDTVLATIVFVFAGLGLLASILKKPGLLKFSGWAVLVVVVFTLIAVYFKVNDYFTFIPFKKLAAAATRIVHYKWLGWIMIITGSLIMIFGGKREIKRA